MLDNYVEFGPPSIHLLNSHSPVWGHRKAFTMVNLPNNSPVTLEYLPVFCSVIRTSKFNYC